jgi:CBS domain-containing protein
MTVRSTVTVEDALQLMKDKGFDQAPVVDVHGYNVFSMISVFKATSIRTGSKFSLTSQ